MLNIVEMENLLFAVSCYLYKRQGFADSCLFLFPY